MCSAPYRQPAQLVLFTQQQAGADSIWLLPLFITPGSQGEIKGWAVGISLGVSKKPLVQLEGEIPLTPTHGWAGLCQLWLGDVPVVSSHHHSPGKVRYHTWVDLHVHSLQAGT